MLATALERYAFYLRVVAWTGLGDGVPRRVFLAEDVEGLSPSFFLRKIAPRVPDRLERWHDEDI